MEPFPWMGHPGEGLDENWGERRIKSFDSEIPLGLSSGEDHEIWGHVSQN